jgi:hypothetical protein
MAVSSGGNVNKRFYVFGGEDTGGFAATAFSLYSCDIIYDNHSSAKLVDSLKVASYGTGVGISGTGKGYYYGG